jgi:RNA polymerase sigma-70 factor (ECF subfamily)
MPDTKPHNSNAPDDASLMARLREGDRAALGELVRRHQQRALEIAVRTLGDPGLAEDVAQEAFLRVWRSAGDYTPKALFTTWLYRIVVNLCLDARKKRRALLGDAPDRADARLAPAEAGLEHADKVAIVRAALERLPERQRTAVVLHKHSGLTMREIAESTGWSESAVESLLVRAYASLRQWLTEFSGQR